MPRRRRNQASYNPMVLGRALMTHFSQQHAPPTPPTNYKLDKEGYYVPQYHPVCIGNQLHNFPKDSNSGCTIYTPIFVKFRLPENTSKLEEFSWVAAQDGNVPENAIVVGMECTKKLIYASRARYITDGINKEVIPAKLIEGKKVDEQHKAYFSWGRREIGATEYEVLCGPAVVWKRTSNGAMPDTAIPVGETSTGDILFMGRAPFLNTLTPGRVHPNPEGIYSLYIGRDGQEIIIKDFEVMCYDMTKDIQRNAVKKIENFWLSKMYLPNAKYVRDVIQSRFEEALQKFT